VLSVNLSAHEQTPGHQSGWHYLHATAAMHWAALHSQPACADRVSVRPTGGLKRSGSSLGQHRRTNAAKLAGSGGSRSHTPSGSMRAGGGAGGGSFGGGPDGAALRSSLAAAGVGGSPKKKALRRVRGVVGIHVGRAGSAAPLKDIKHSAGTLK